MTPARFHTLIEGAVHAWRADVTLNFDDTNLRCRVNRGGQECVSVAVERQPFGTVWRIAEAGRRERVHASIVPALRGLREILAPERSAGRVLFVQGDHG